LKGIKYGSAKKLGCTIWAEGISTKDRPNCLTINEWANGLKKSYSIITSYREEEEEGRIYIYIV